MPLRNVSYHPFRIPSLPTTASPPFICLALKSADDTTVEGLIKNSVESSYRQQVDRLVSWSGNNNLDLNTSKAKEMIIDFRKETLSVVPLLIDGSSMEIVDTYKFLGTIISSGLDWEENINYILKKTQQRMYFLRQLKKFGLRREILVQFYIAVIESVLCFSLTVWYGSTTKDQRRRLNRVVRNAGRIVGCELPPWEELHCKRTVARSRRIIADRSHPANDLFQLLPSGRRHRVLRARTNRLCSSFSTRPSVH